jgi:hypothetical protein
MRCRWPSSEVDVDFAAIRIPSDSAVLQRISQELSEHCGRQLRVIDTTAPSEVSLTVIERGADGADCEFFVTSLSVPLLQLRRLAKVLDGATDEQYRLHIGKDRGLWAVRRRAGGVLLHTAVRILPVGDHNTEGVVERRGGRAPGRTSHQRNRRSCGGAFPMRSTAKPQPMKPGLDDDEITFFERRYL